jgi:TolA-binding protein
MQRQPPWLLRCALFVTCCMVAAPLHAQDLSKVVTELTLVEGEAEQLRSIPLRKAQLRSATYVEERLTDGELFFRLKDYVRASIIFTDIVDNYPQHVAYPDALFLLGESLYHAGDYLGARTRFREMLARADEGVFRQYVQRALGRLIEIAIKVRDFDGVDDYFARLSRLPPAEVEDATAYFRAKYLYSVAVADDVLPPNQGPEEQLDPTKLAIDAAALEQARVAFEVVSARSPYYPQARYFIGVIHTLRGQYGQAVDAFKRVCQLKPTDEAQRTVVELAELGLGRVQYEMDKLPEAINAYQLIPRTSPNFDAALYEIAWVYIRQGDSSRAERALEVLSVAVPDSKYIPDAKILRGNLLLRNGRFDAAQEVFEELSAQFAPVRDELDGLVANHEDPAEHFRVIVRENMESFEITSFLPPLALRWATMEGDMERAMGALADLSQARRLVRETSDIATRLNRALEADNPENVFPDLRVHRERTVALRNRLSSLRQKLSAIEAKTATGAKSPELTTLQGQRREVEKQLAALPTSDKDFNKRSAQADGDFKALRTQLSHLEVDLMGMEAKITATERFASDTLRGKGQDAGLEALLAELKTHSEAIAAYRERMGGVRNDVEAGRLRVGVGDSTFDQEEALRLQHAALVTQERALLASMGVRSNPQVDSAYRRIDGAEMLVAAHDASVDAVVADRVKEMRQVLDEEGAKLVQYRDRLQALEGESEIVIGGVAYINFNKVRGRFYELVLRADVGVIDVGWARREEHRMRVEMLTRERTRAIKALDDEFREIMEGGEK